MRPDRLHATVNAYVLYIHSRSRKRHYNGVQFEYTSSALFSFFPPRQRNSRKAFDGAERLETPFSRQAEKYNGK